MNAGGKDRNEQSSGDGNQNQGARKGGEALGGSTSRREDPVDALEGHARAATDDAAMRKRGFGDHKGGRI